MHFDSIRFARRFVRQHHDGAVFPSARGPIWGGVPRTIGPRAGAREPVPRNRAVELYAAGRSQHLRRCGEGLHGLVRHGAWHENVDGGAERRAVQLPALRARARARTKGQRRVVRTGRAVRVAFGAPASGTEFEETKDRLRTSRSVREGGQDRSQRRDSEADGDVAPARHGRRSGERAELLFGRRDLGEVQTAGAFSSCALDRKVRLFRGRSGRSC